MKAIEIKQAANSLAKYARSARKHPVVLTLDGEPVAALVGLESVDLESLSLSTNPKFISLIQASRTRYKSEGGRTSEEVRRRLQKRPKRTA